MAHHERKNPPQATRPGDTPPDSPETPRFPLGRLLITPNAEQRLNPDDVHTCIDRHAAGDWGDCGPADRDENDRSLVRQRRILSVYRDRRGTKFWVITEADRSATTVLLPDDY
ncbi:MAG: hypothetical protein CHACPFDD_00863 [Phycisphaerae bacterium]|nr:hypothetical protein [Phycisphaerae bacterium]